MKKIIYALTAVMLASVSCTSEPEPGIGPGEEPSRYLTFTLTAGGGDKIIDTRATPAPLTRGVPGDDDFNENLVDADDIHLFLFYATDYGEGAGEGECAYFALGERMKLELYSEEGGEIVPDKYFLHLDLKASADGGVAYPEIDNETASNILFGRTFDMLVVANSGLPRETFQADENADELSGNLNRKAVMDVLYENELLNNVANGVVTPQAKFAMTGESRHTYSSLNNYVTDFTLRRLAAKFQLGLADVAVDGFEVEAVQVKLVNGVNQSRLHNYTGQLAVPTPSRPESGYVNVPIPDPDGAGDVEYSAPLYSFEADWSTDLSQEAYLLVKATMIPDGELVGTDYYYKVPVSYLASDVENGAEFRNRIRRNYIYRYFLRITRRGSLNPDTPVNLQSNLSILSWDEDQEQAVEVVLQKFDWLLVNERNVVIYPGTAWDSVMETGQDEDGYTTYLIAYRSSSDLDITTLRATYDARVREGGTTNIVTTNCEGDQIPQIDVNYTGPDGQKYIRVRTLEPDNYAVKDISLRVENDAHLFATVTIEQYPPLFVDMRISEDNVPTGLPGGLVRPTGADYSDYNIYTITTLTKTDHDYFDWDTRTTTVNPEWGSNVNTILYTNRLGNPRGEDGNYVNTPQNAWTISPKFILASDYGLPGPAGQGGAPIGALQAVAEARCAAYAEDIYGVGTWRLPTLGELYLLYKLNADPNSVVEGIFNMTQKPGIYAAGTYHLTGAQSASAGIYFDQGTGTSADSQTNGSHAWRNVKCVRDVYY